MEGSGLLYPSAGKGTCTINSRPKSNQAICWKIENWHLQTLSIEAFLQKDTKDAAGRHHKT